MFSAYKNQPNAVTGLVTVTVVARNIVQIMIRKFKRENDPKYWWVLFSIHKGFVWECRWCKWVCKPQVEEDVALLKESSAFGSSCFPQGKTHHPPEFHMAQFRLRWSTEKVNSKEKSHISTNPGSARNYFKELYIEQKSFIYQALIPQNKIKSSLALLRDAAISNCF